MAQPELSQLKGASEEFAASWQVVTFPQRYPPQEVAASALHLVSQANNLRYAVGEAWLSPETAEALFTGLFHLSHR